MYKLYLFSDFPNTGMVLWLNLVENMMNCVASQKTAWTEEPNMEMEGDKRKMVCYNFLPLIRDVNYFIF